MASDALARADEPEPFARRRFDVHATHIDRQIGGDVRSNGFAMLAESRSFGQYGQVDVYHCIALSLQQRLHVTHELTTVRAAPLRIGVREMHADVAESNSTKQRVAQCMQHHVPIRMRPNAVRMRNSHSTQSHELACLESVNVIALTDSQSRHSVSFPEYRAAR